MSADGTISLSLEPTPAAPGRARRILRRLLPEGDGITGDAELLLSELITNSVLHGGDEGVEAIEVRAIRTRDLLHVEVWDQGRGFVDALRGQRSSAPGSGWGLMLLDRIAARWGIARQGRTCVWFEIETRNGN